jgi:hypothetical protein
MSRGILEEEDHLVHHDLESFYWVLIWIVLRYTSHQHKDGKNACMQLFDHHKENILSAIKLTWLLHSQLTIKDNKPLTTLLTQLSDLFLAQQSSRLHPGIPLTHDTMLEAFDKALLDTGWPENDVARDFKVYN